MTTLVLTDIHGCYNEMISLIERVNPTNVIIAGDLIDRGPDSFKVVQYCMETPNVQVCLGNHELMFLEAMDLFNKTNSKLSLKFTDWWCNGGEAVFNTTSLVDLVIMADYFKTLPLFIQTDYKINDLPVVVSHTAINVLSYNVLDIIDNNYKCSIADSIVWTRTQPTNPVQPFFSIFGHTPVPNLQKSITPMQTKGGINLDTGCAYGYCLSGIVLPSMEIVQSTNKEYK